MKIEITKYEELTLNDLKPGVAFWYNKKLYMKTQGGEGTANCVQLSNGYLLTWTLRGCEFEVADVKIVND